MKFYIKQKVFSIRDKFKIYDMGENEMFHAESEILSLGKKLHLMNNNGEEVSFIHQELLSFLPRFYININGEEAAEVVKKFTFLKQKYEISGIDWSVSGDFFAHDYVIESPSGIVAKISKQWLTWGDTYEIDIVNNADIVMVLSVVLIIDAVMAQSAAAAASN